MKNRIGRWIYGDHSYYIAHIVIGAIIMGCIWGLIHFVFKQPLNVVLRLISNETVELSASLLGFQLAGVSILISLEGNKKLALLKEIESDTMIMKIFISSISMFLLSIILMIMSLNFFEDSIEIVNFIWYCKTMIDYCSVIFFVLGIVFLFSSIRLLKWFCAK